MKLSVKTTLLLVAAVTLAVWGLRDLDWRRRPPPTAPSHLYFVVTVAPSVEACAACGRPVAHAPAEDGEGRPIDEDCYLAVFLRRFWAVYFFCLLVALAHIESLRNEWRGLLVRTRAMI